MKKSGSGSPLSDSSTRSEGFDEFSRELSRNFSQLMRPSRNVPPKNIGVTRQQSEGRRNAARDGVAFLSIDMFMNLFRIDREAVPLSVVDKMQQVLSKASRRLYQANEIILKQGDATAAKELLIFIQGDVRVSTNAQRSSRGSRTSFGDRNIETEKMNRDSRSTRSTIADEFSTERISRRTIDDIENISDPSEELAISSPFYIGEERVVRGSWPTATYKCDASGCCRCFVLTETDIARLIETGGFDIERILRLRAFERTLAKHGLYVSVLRDTVFIHHFMLFLLEVFCAENLCFLVDLMKFKKETPPSDPFEFVQARFNDVWEAYLRPWGSMSTVPAIECPTEVLDEINTNRNEAFEKRSSELLLLAFDPAARAVKKFLESVWLPAFVQSPAYPIFLQERFPMAEDSVGTNLSSLGNSTHRRKSDDSTLTDSNDKRRRSSGNTLSMLFTNQSNPAAVHPAPESTQSQNMAAVQLALDSTNGQQQPAETTDTTTTSDRRGSRRISLNLDPAALIGLRRNSQGQATETGARPALQLKLANMTKELHQIDQTYAQSRSGGKGVSSSVEKDSALSRKSANIGMLNIQKHDTPGDTVPRATADMLGLISKRKSSDDFEISPGTAGPSSSSFQSSCHTAPTDMSDDEDDASSNETVT